MIDKIVDTITKYNLISNNDKVLIAVSGGADSVCLLRVLLILKERFQLSLLAAHLNHCLRGAEADRDEEFCRNICKEYNIPFYSKKSDVAKIAKNSKISCEEAGRNERYRFFCEVKIKYNIDKIATAHNQNDNAETVLMHFIRGCSIDGLTGIPYKNGDIIRPLINISRAEIESFLSKLGQDFITDSSNLTDDFTRNKIRHNVLPEILKINPSFSETLSCNINSFKENSDFFSCYCDNFIQSCCNITNKYISVNKNELKSIGAYPAKMVIKELMKKLGCQISSAKINELFDAASSENIRICVSNNITCYVLYDTFYLVYNKKKQDFYMPINNCPFLNMEKTDKLTVSSEKNIAYIDCAEINLPLYVRNRKDGDWFYPLGLTGKKKLKDYFIDKKIPVFMRDNIPIIISGNNIVWICGYCLDDRFKVTAQTKSILKITYMETKL